MLKKQTKTHLIQLALFIATVFTTTYAGSTHQNLHWMEAQQAGDEWGAFWSGLYFSVPFIIILGAHEFGHYFMARKYKMKVTLPYFIPLPTISIIGTMGAVIRLKSPTLSTKQFFDVGIAGPLAGFVLALGLTWYGYTHLPERETIYHIHPEYEQYDQGEQRYEEVVYSQAYLEDQGLEGMPMLALGSNLLFQFFENVVVEDKADIPNPYEKIHNPFLMAGFIAFLFTAINLMPIGQLDGGHVLYGLLGHKRHKKVAEIMFVGFVFYAGLGLIDLQDNNVWLYLALYMGFLFFVFRRMYPDRNKVLILALAVLLVQLLVNRFIGWEGYSGWLIFAFFVGRFAGIEHPKAMIEHPLDQKRKILGWLALAIFVLCLSPAPLTLT